MKRKKIIGVSFKNKDYEFLQKYLENYSWNLEQWIIRLVHKEILRLQKEDKVYESFSEYRRKIIENRENAMISIFSELNDQ